MFRYGFKNNREDFRTIVNEVDFLLKSVIQLTVLIISFLQLNLALSSAFAQKATYIVSYSVPMIFIVFRLFLVYCFYICRNLYSIFVNLYCKFFVLAAFARCY